MTTYEARARTRVGLYTSVFGLLGVLLFIAVVSMLSQRTLDDSVRSPLIAAACFVGLVFAVGFVGILLWLRRHLDAAHQVEIAKLAALATTDPLTGLRNHRAFHEDLARDLQLVGRGVAHLSLVLLDLDGIRVVNDTFGHQVGDRHLTALADALRATVRASDRAYRTGGDEFAIVLAGERAWGALELAQRLQAVLGELDLEQPLTVSAGIADTTEFCAKELILRRADLALLAARATRQTVVLYTPELELPPDATTDRHDTNALASALALAVDAKDSYTRSHCQTVSQLCALVATELQLDPARIAQMRVAGLLHDVGKIGVPDAILNKPAKLTDEEFAVMRQHSVLGAEIVHAADLPQEARWIRNHHERYDGAGYPDRLAADDIPLESRIILACDAYEAMTSNRAYREAPGHVFALGELRRHSGTQFDPQVVSALCATLDRRIEVSDDGALTVELATA